MSESTASTRRALVLGVNGQDGSYLAESLLENGWQVCGLARQPSPAPFVDARVRYIAHDLSDVDIFAQRLAGLAPQAVFHAAAVHGPAGFAYENVCQQAHAVNTLCAHATLEYARRHDPALRFFYFSSSKVFGSLAGRTIREDTPRVSGCIYSATKNCATDLVQHYRQHFGLAASVLWFFHHESPRRRAGYFIPTMVAHLARACADRHYQSPVHSLDFWSDWGDAQEYMRMLAKIADQAPGQDLIFATGRSLHARNLVDKLFAAYGLNYREHLVEAPSTAPDASQPWQVDIAELTRAFGRAPTQSVLDTCARMLESPIRPTPTEARP